METCFEKKIRKHANGSNGYVDYVAIPNLGTYDFSDHFFGGFLTTTPTCGCKPT